MTAGEGLIHLLRLGRASVAHFLRPSHAPSEDPAAVRPDWSFPELGPLWTIVDPRILGTMYSAIRDSIKMAKFPVTADEEDCLGVMWGRVSRR